MADDHDLTTVLLPEDEYPHEPDAAANYNESMYLNAFDLEREVGGWFRLGNRVNEGYAELSVCAYLPGGRVGFVYARPPIDTNERMEAGGLSIEVVTPFEELRVRYDGTICVLDEPRRMADPRTAFKENPWLACESTSPTVACRRCTAAGASGPTAPSPRSTPSRASRRRTTSSTARSPARSGSATRCSRSTGSACATSRGAAPLAGDRLVPLAADHVLARLRDDDLGRVGAAGGMVLVGDQYHLIRDCTIESDWTPTATRPACGAPCAPITTPIE
ncbi:MAG: hypothetical protein R2697_18915 [Ilumatobacteraceae bacterium]